MIDDLRLALRQLRRRPLLAAVIVGSLAIGLGANTVVFTLVDALLLHPLPGVAEPDRLVAVFATAESRPGALRRLTFDDLADLAALEGPWSSVAAWSASAMSLGPVQPDGESERIPVQGVTPAYFDTLGAIPHAGRFFTSGESARVVVVSERFARRRFGPGGVAVGRELLVNGSAVTVVGVAPPRFAGSDLTATPDLWLPLDAYLELARGVIAQYSTRDRRQAWLHGIARLAPGATLGSAQGEADALATRLAASFPDTNAGRGVRLLPLREVALGNGQRGDVARFATLWTAVVGAVLLVTCFNVANLMLARARERRREVAVRLSLGASGARLLRLFLIESLVLAAIGAALALALAATALPVLARLALPVAATLEPRLAGIAVAFTLAIALLSGLVFGLAPAIGASRGPLVPFLSRAGPKKRFFPRDLDVVAESAVALVVLIAAGLFFRNLARLEAIDPGFRTEGVLTAAVDLAGQGYAAPRVVAFYDELRHEVDSASDVESVSMAAGVPLLGSVLAVELTIEPEAYVAPTKAASPPAARHAMIGEAYFSTVGIPIVAGRDFAGGDDASSSLVAVVNETLARRFWPDQDPLGRRLQLIQTPEPCTVVGVVADSRSARLTDAAEPVVYLHHAQAPRSFLGPLLAPEMTLLVRATSGDAEALAPVVRRAVRRLDPQVPVWNVRPLAAVVAGSIRLQRQTTALLGGAAAVAVGLALLGLYGTLAGSVVRRRRELAVRAALGAAPTALRSLVVRRGLSLLAAGVALGLATAAALLRLVEARFYGVALADPLTASLAVAALLLAAIGVALVPAQRAATVDPAAALREDSA